MPKNIPVHKSVYRSKSISRFPAAMMPLVFFTIIFCLSGCSTQLPTVPAFSTDGQHQPGKIIWHDLVTPDLQQARNFYSKLFGWSFEDLTDGYTLIKHNGNHIGGMARHRQSGNSAYWVPLMSVPDVDKAVKYTTQSGGELLLKAFELPGRGRIAVVNDPQGAIFAVAQTTQGDPVNRKAGVNDWLWNEVWTDDIKATKTYYTGLVGFQLGEAVTDKGTYHYLKYQGIPRAGLIKNQDYDIANTWVAYIRVEDVKAAAAQVEALGGKILMSPRPDIRNGSVAVITDPSGAGLVIQEWVK